MPEDRVSTSKMGIEWDVYLEGGEYLGAVIEGIPEEPGRDLDEFARCAALSKFSACAFQDYSVSPTHHTWDELDALRRQAARASTE